MCANSLEEEQSTNYQLQWASSPENPDWTVNYTSWGRKLQSPRVVPIKSFYRQSDWIPGNLDGWKWKNTALCPSVFMSAKFDSDRRSFMTDIHPITLIWMWVSFSIWSFPTQYLNNIEEAGRYWCYGRIYVTNQDGSTR